MAIQVLVQSVSLYIMYLLVHGRIMHVLDYLIAKKSQTSIAIL